MPVYRPHIEPCKNNIILMKIKGGLFTRLPPILYQRIICVRSRQRKLVGVLEVEVVDADNQRFKTLTVV